MASKTKRQCVDGDNLGTDVIVSNSEGFDAEHVPLCPHGPCLLFERFLVNRPSRKFFACSACRDRKECQMFQWKDEKLTKGKQIVQDEMKKNIKQLTKKRKLMNTTLGKLEESDTKNASYCFDCNLLTLDEKCVKSECTSNNVKRVSLDSIHRPSKLLKPLAVKKSNAQYLFTDSCCQFLVDSLLKLKFTKVLCLGTPRLHEGILNSKKAKKQGLKSLLLDIDMRHANFYNSEEMVCYNMFNDYFFIEKERAIVHEFLKHEEPEKIVIVVDPPFGGLMSVLANAISSWSTVWSTVNNIDSKKEIPTILVFPYFLEPHVKNSRPSLQMSDYKVAYENHATYKNENSSITKTRQSPVRLFTNIKLESIKLPAEEGYRLCDKCRKYVAENNIHCSKCDICPSKDGHTYVHCEKCKKCVKPGRYHCKTCDRCEPPRHDCQSNIAPSELRCHICGEQGHKRQYCPQNKTNKRSSLSGKKKPSPKRRRSVRIIKKKLLDV